MSIEPNPKVRKLLSIFPAVFQRK